MASEKKNLTPIIIGGHGRSGTTFLTRCICSHSSVISPRHESNLFAGFHGLIRLTNLLSTEHDSSLSLYQWNSLRAFVKKQTLLFLSDTTTSLNGGSDAIKLYIDSFFSNLEISRFAFKGSEGAKKNKDTHVITRCFDLADVNVLINEYVSKWFLQHPLEKTHWVEKTPRNVLAFSRLATAFPEAKLIHIHRDPRDVIASTAIHPWAPPEIKFSIEMYSNWLTRWEMICDEVRGLPNYLEISYKDFCSDPEVWVQLFNHLELDVPVRPVIKTVNEGRHKKSWKTWHYELFNKLVKDRVLVQGFL